MSRPSAKNERTTAIVSTLVAIAILAAGVTAQQSHQAPQDELTRLESDLRFQLERAFKHDGRQRTKRMAQVDQVIQAWQDSPKSNQDHTLFATWLAEATTHSMPGSSQAFPPAPQFGQVDPVDHQPTEIQPPTETVAETANPTSVAPLPVETAPVSTDVKIIAEETKQTETAAPIAFEVKTAPSSPFMSVLSTTNNDNSDFATAAPTHEALPQVEPKSSTKTNDLPIRINLVELNARINGYHTSLDAVETKLLTLDTPNIDAIAQQVQQLNEMTRDFHFIHLYYESLTDKERRAISPPRSMKATLAEIHRHLNRYEKAQNDDFLSIFDSAKNEQLDALRNQLATIAKRVAR
ncbi:MAG: hypothetical protein GXP26_15975 [Planctomycetes bacterium]|nr:hypothetical protein [Planctomycetota bacterium]